jgi:hypothetical protein
MLNKSEMPRTESLEIAPSIELYRERYCDCFEDKLLLPSHRGRALGYRSCRQGDAMCIDKISIKKIADAVPWLLFLEKTMSLPFEP